MTYPCSKRPGRMVVAGLFAMITLLTVSIPALAQSDSNPTWDWFIGYQWAHPGAGVPAPYGDPSNPTAFEIPDMGKGFGTSLTRNFDPHWGLEADFGHNWGSGNYELTASVGPRFIWRTDYANYFVHAMVSYNRVSVSGLGDPSNGIGSVMGGGIDLPLKEHFAWRLFEADYVWARHNYADFASPDFPGLRRPSFEGVRLRTGLVFSWGGAAPLTPAAACTVQPTEVMIGEPITANVTASNFNPKHTVTYTWSGNGGGTVTGKDNAASIDTTNAAPGNYTVTAHVADPREKKNNEASCTASYTVKPLPPKNPPTMSLSASPNDLITGGNVSLSASCTSPDGVPVSVANWTSTSGSVSGSGNSASLNTAGMAPGTYTITAICTDSRGLTAQATAQVTVEAPPPPKVDKALEARLALHSIYFPTNMPPVKDPNAGLVPSQQKTLTALAADFKKYLEAKPDAHLILQGHADVRGAVAFNQALSERRVARVKSFLIEQGVSESAIESEAFGSQHNLTLDEVKASIDQNTDLSTEERKRAIARINVIKLASNRRVDVTLKAAGMTENSVRQFPFSATDALTLIGGRESEMKAAKPMPKKKAAPKKQ